jgi:hypothetical protein
MQTLFFMLRAPRVSVVKPARRRPKGRGDRTGTQVKTCDYGSNERSAGRKAMETLFFMLRALCVSVVKPACRKPKGNGDLSEKPAETKAKQAATYRPETK